MFLLKIIGDYQHMFFFFFSLFLIEYQLITNIPAGARDIEIRDMNGAGHFLGKLDFVTCFVQCVQSTDIQRKSKNLHFFVLAWRLNWGLQVFQSCMACRDRGHILFCKNPKTPNLSPIADDSIARCHDAVYEVWDLPCICGTISCWRWCWCHLAVIVPVCQLY